MHSNRHLLAFVKFGMLVKRINRPKQAISVAKDAKVPKSVAGAIELYSLPKVA